MEQIIIDLNRIPACVSLQSVTAVLSFLGQIEEAYRPHKLYDLDSKLADGIEQLRDHFTSSFQPTAPDFSLEVQCCNPIHMIFNSQGETLSCNITCEHDVLTFKCSATVNGYVTTSTLFQTNLACPLESDSLPQLLSWVSVSEKILQEIPISVAHRFSPDFQFTNLASNPA